MSNTNFVQFFKETSLTEIRYLKLINSASNNINEVEYLEVIDNQYNVPVVRMINKQVYERTLRDLFNEFPKEIATIRKMKAITGDEFYAAFDEATKWLRAGTSVVEDSFFHNVHPKLQ